MFKKLLFININKIKTRFNIPLNNKNVNYIIINPETDIMKIKINHKIPFKHRFETSDFIPN